VLTDAPEVAGFFFQETVRPDPQELVAKGLTPSQSAEVARRTYEVLSGLPNLCLETAEPPMRALVEEMGLSAGQVFGILRVAVTGQKVSPPLFESIELIPRETVLNRVSEAVKMLEDLALFDLGCLRHCVVAGEPLNPEVFKHFHEQTGLKLMEGSGQTECTVAMATYPWLEPKPGSMGKPSPGYDISVVDEEGNPCEIGIEGEIVIRTARRKPVGMFRGYYRDTEMTERVWSGDVYRTGDMAWCDEDGYYWFVGRADDIIKSSGYRIGPFEVESALIEHPAVLECAVTAVPDPDRGQIVKATVVLSRNYHPGEELAKELQEHVKRVTAPDKSPRIVEFVTALPKPISGKIRRVQIRENES